MKIVNPNLFLIVFMATWRCNGYRHFFDISEASQTPSACTANIPASTLSTFTWQPMTVTGQPTGALNPNEARGAFDYICAQDKIYYWMQDAASDPLWILDLATNSWSRPSVALPSCSKSFSTKWNPVNNHILIFCGVNSSNIFTNEVIDFDPVTFQYAVIATGTLPIRRTPAIAYDNLRNRFVVFGGCNNATSCFAASNLQDTWAFNLNNYTWQDLSAMSPPSVRYLAAMEYDVQTDRIILYGGGNNNGATLLGDTCTYDPTGNSWTCTTPANSPACTGYENSFTYIDSLGKILMFGGRDGANCNDLRSVSGPVAAWLNLTEANTPAARGSHGAIYDRLRNRLVIYGGRASAGACSPACFDMHELRF
jgi:hypothetical protein